VMWASVVPPDQAHFAVNSLLLHPKATFVFYRLSMSGVTFKIVAFLLEQLACIEPTLVTPILTKHIRGARYAGRIRKSLGLGITPLPTSHRL
jgi:hypothetical protein